jgi:magnesium transporter
MATADRAALVSTCFVANESRLREGLPPDELHRLIRAGEGLLWVDVLADGRAAGDVILRDVFSFHPLTIDDCYNTLIDPPKVDDYGDYLFVIIHNVVYDPVAQQLTTNELDMYIGKNYVVTVHRAPVHAVDEVLRRARQHTPVMQRGAGFLAHALFDVVVDDFHPVVEAIDDQVAAIEELVIDRPEREILQEVLRLKRNTQRLRRSITPQRDVVIRFARGEYGRLIPADALMYFRDVYDHTVRVGETIESVRDLADGALNTYLSSVNNRINEVMKTLAIVAAIFLPLTLIASIYGTNFADTYPQYGWAPGFFVMSAAMGVIAAGLIWFFRWRRWF